MSKIGNLDRTELTTHVKESLILTAGVLGVSFASSKVLKDNLGVTLSGKSAMKLAAAIIGSNLVVLELRKMGYLK